MPPGVCGWRAHAALRYACEFMRRILFSLFAFLCSNLVAQQVSPELFNGLQWRLIGPFRAGRVVAVSGAADGGSTFYFGGVDGGVWKTEDAGVVWTPVFDNQPVASIGALEVAPSDPNVVYAGTGESDIRSDLASGDGVYKSVDAGKTWTNVGLKETRQISRIVVNPRDPNIVFVAALGHAYGPSAERGVFRSTDGGETWQNVLNRGPQIGAADLAMAFDEPNVLFASMWEAHRPPWSTYAPLAGPGSGLFRSVDGGNTWRQLTGHGLPAGDWGRVGVAIARGTLGKRIYAAIDAKDSGLYRSDDQGETWERVNKDPRVTSRAWYFNCITVDPNDPDVVYVPNVALYKLAEGGTKLSIVRGAPGGDDYHQLWVDPRNSRHMVLGVDQGATVSLDGGNTWSTWYNQPTAQFYHVATDNDFPYHVYGAQQDSGTAATASQTGHGEIDTRDWFTVGGSESGYIAPDPKDPNIFYVSGTYGTVGRFDRRTMQTQNIAPWPLSGFGTEITQHKYRDPWTPVLLFSPAQSNALYLGSQYVMKTLDGGLHWQTISPDLTGAVKADKTDSATAVTIDNAKELGYGVVYTIAPSPVSAAEIWAGSDTGLIHLTRDGGKTWANVTPPGLSAWSKIAFIECSHSNPAEAYAAVDRHRLDDRRPYLYRTRDFGKTWQPIVNGIGEHSFLNAIREDPKRKGLLFACTEFGVYVSFTDGDRWVPLQLNLPVTSVRDLVIHGDDLIVATHGRAFWALDDIASLRQVAENVAASDIYLYKPARATRVTSDSFAGTPVPPEEPQAQNPPRGAYIDYYLRSPAGDLTLDILDGSGKAVRHFSNGQKLPNRPVAAAIAPRWFPKPQRLNTEAGMHRFVWDLKVGREGEKSTADMEDTGVEVFVGPLVLPGTYRVRLTVNGREFVQPFEVAMDPRSHVTAADLALQFHWAQRAFDDMVAARTLEAEIRTLRIAIAKTIETQSAAPADLRHALDSANQACGRILTGTGQGSVDGVEALSRAFTTALGAIESADRVPPSQVIALYRESDVTLKMRSSEWRAFQQRTLPEINRQLREASLPSIAISAPQ